RIVRFIHGKDKRSLLFCQSKELLDLLKPILVFALIQQDLAITVIDDRLFHYRRRNDIFHVLGDHNGLPKEFTDRLEQVFDIGRKPFFHQGLPSLFDQDHLAHSFLLAHLIDKYFHDNDRHHWKQDRMIFDVIQLKNDKALVK